MTSLDIETYILLKLLPMEGTNRCIEQLFSSSYGPDFQSLRKREFSILIVNDSELEPFDRNIVGLIVYIFAVMLTSPTRLTLV